MIRPRAAIQSGAIGITGGCSVARLNFETLDCWMGTGCLQFLPNANSRQHKTQYAPGTTSAPNGRNAAGGGEVRPLFRVLLRDGMLQLGS